MATEAMSHAGWAGLLDRFESLVKAGGEVSAEGLRDRMKEAESLVCHIEAGEVVAIAALKNPRDSYRRKVAERSGCPLPKDAYPHEVGWVYVDPRHRGKRLSIKLIEACLEVAGPKGVFATARLDNPHIHTPLERCNFRQAGGPYASGRGDFQLVLFVHTPEPGRVGAARRLGPGGA